MTIARTANLQAALDERAKTTDVNAALVLRQPLIQDGALTIARTSGLQAALDEKAKTTDVTTALASRQPTLGSTSAVVVDTIKSRLYFGDNDVFRIWKSDQTSALVTIAQNALGAEFTMPIRTTQLYVAQYMGVGGITVPEAELDVLGSIRCSASLVAGNLDVVGRLIDLTANKQPLVVDNSMQIRHVNLLQDMLDAKQPLLSDLVGTGVSLTSGTKLRKVFGTNGVSVSHFSDPFNLAHVSTGQIQISAQELETAITLLQQKTSAFSSTSFLPTSTYATYITGNLNVQTCKTTGVFLTPLILAPERCCWPSWLWWA